MASIQSLLEDWKNWSNLQDWKLQKQREEMFGGDYQLAEDVSKWGGGFNPSNIGAGLGGLAGAIKAYHGSPSAFTKFLMSKLGTGEGAQAYGHGLYFAQAPEVAADYAQTLARKEGQVASIGKKSLTDFYTEIENKANKLPPHLAEKEYEKLAFLEDLDQQPTFQSALSRIDDPDVETWAKTLEKSYTPAGNMYEVSLQWPNPAKEAADPLGEHHLLDWDAPLSEQPPKVLNALKTVDLSTVNPRVRKLIEQGGADGQTIYKAFGGYENPASASSKLKDLGIPGIRYLDQGSRGTSGGQLLDVFQGPKGWQSKIKVANRGGAGFMAPTDTFTTSMPFKTEEEARKWAADQINQGTRNYVMFDERFPNIVSRNGVSLVDLLRK